MRRADRLFQIVQQLRGGRLVTAQQLAERLEVSERTIYRDIADLVRTGVPVEGAAGVGYVLRKGFDLPPLMFTTDEVVALVVGARLLQTYGGADMAAASQEALVKISAVLPAPASRRAEAVPVEAFAPPSALAARPFLDVLSVAINESRRVRLAYRDEAGVGTDRLVQPLGLYFWGRVWTLVAWCELRDAFRMFRVDRIELVEPGLRFRPDPARSLSAAFAAEGGECAPPSERHRADREPAKGPAAGAGSP